jgi:glutaconate CoA-transferase subunit B
VSLPSRAELAVIRSVDPLGVRRQEFSPAELQRVFEHGSGDTCGC